MSAAMTGALIGAVVGLVSFATLRWGAAKAEGNGADAQKRRVGAVIRATALADLLLFPVIGYVVGPMLFDA
jgi:hypothetical protein